MKKIGIKELVEIWIENKSKEEIIAYISDMVIEKNDIEREMWKLEEELQEEREHYDIEEFLNEIKKLKEENKELKEDLVETIDNYETVYNMLLKDYRKLEQQLQEEK